MKSRRRAAALIILPLVALALISTAVVRAQPDAEADRDWQIDPIHSSVVFRIMHANTAPFYGTFNEIDGVITTGSRPAIRFTIPVESIDTRNPQRDAHVKSPDFFDAEQFPAITFESTDVQAAGDTYHVTGDLTLHGVTKSIHVEVRKTGQTHIPHPQMGDIIGFEALVTIKRSDFGMDFMLDMLGDEIRLMIGLEAKGG